MQPSAAALCLLLLVACATSPRQRLPESPPRVMAEYSAGEFTIAGGKLLLPCAVDFAPGEASPTAASEPALLHVAEFLQARPAISLLRVEAHGDGASDAAAAQALSEARAFAVALRLYELGVDDERLLPVGFGNARPLAGSSSGNERIEFRPAEMRGRAIGGMPVDGGGRVAGRRDG